MAAASLQDAIYTISNTAAFGQTYYLSDNLGTVDAVTSNSSGISYWALNSLTLNSPSGLVVIVVADCADRPSYLSVVDGALTAGPTSVSFPNPYQWFLWTTHDGYYIIAEPSSSNNIGLLNSTNVALAPASVTSSDGSDTDPTQIWNFTMQPQVTLISNPYNCNRPAPSIT